MNLSGHWGVFTKEIEGKIMVDEKKEYRFGGYGDAELLSNDELERSLAGHPTFHVDYPCQCSGCTLMRDRANRASRVSDQRPWEEFELEKVARELTAT